MIDKDRMSFSIRRRVLSCSTLILLLLVSAPPCLGEDIPTTSEFDIGNEKNSDVAAAWERWRYQLLGAVHTIWIYRNAPQGGAVVRVRVSKDKKISTEILSCTGDQSLKDFILSIFKDLDGNSGLTFPKQTTLADVSMTFALPVADPSITKDVSPFEFKGTRLGISLNQWKEHPYPLEKGQRVATVAESQKDGRLVYRLRLTDERGNTLPVTLARQEATSAFWLFKPDTHNVMRLAEMEFGFEPNNYGIVLDALNQKYGQSEVSMRPDSRICTWSNRTSVVSLTHKYSERSCILRFAFNSPLDRNTPTQKLDLS